MRIKPTKLSFSNIVLRSSVDNIEAEVHVTSHPLFNIHARQQLVPCPCGLGDFKSITFIFMTIKCLGGIDFAWWSFNGFGSLIV